MENRSPQGPTPLHRGAVTDWRLGPDAPERAPSMLKGMFWDARPVEMALPAALCVLVPALVVGRAMAPGLGWSAMQSALAALLAMNVGFAVAIGTTPIKRYFHHRGDVRGADLATMLGDAAMQVLLFDWFFPGGSLNGPPFGYSLRLAGWVVLCGLLVTFSPLYIRRAIAHLCFLGGVAMALYGLPTVAGMEWFPFVGLYKYLSAHLPRKEAYRPTE